MGTRRIDRRGIVEMHMQNDEPRQHEEEVDPQISLGQHSLDRRRNGCNEGSRAEAGMEERDTKRGETARDLQRVESSASLATRENPGVS
jgi:hypothetical protein